MQSDVDHLFVLAMSILDFRVLLYVRTRLPPETLYRNEYKYVRIIDYPESCRFHGIFHLVFSTGNSSTAAAAKKSTEQARTTKITK